MNILKAAGLAVALAFTGSALAREGFSASPNVAPRPVAYFWNSIFLLYVTKSDESATGSAFVIERQETEAYTALYLLTAGHVVDGARRIRLARNFSGASWGQVDNFERWIPTREVRVLNADADLDLALIQVVLPRPLNPPAAVLRVAPNCEIQKGAPIFLMGFPATYRRTRYRVPIAYQNLVLERWSTGYYIGNFTLMSEGRPTRYSGVTNDSLNGDSGGPLIDNRGYVIGLADANLSRSDSGFAYRGDESPYRMAWNTLAVPCERLIAFLERPAQSR